MCPLQDARSVERFAAELLEAEIAAYRLRQIPERHAPAFGRCGPAMRQGKRGRPKSLAPEQIQVLLHLRNQKGVTVAALAERFGISITSVSRILQKYEQTEHHEMYHAHSHTPSDASQISLPGSKPL